MTTVGAAELLITHLFKTDELRKHQHLVSELGKDDLNNRIRFMEECGGSKWYENNDLKNYNDNYNYLASVVECLICKNHVWNGILRSGSYVSDFRPANCTFRTNGSGQHARTYDVCLPCSQLCGCPKWVNGTKDQKGEKKIDASMLQSCVACKKDKCAKHEYDQASFVFSHAINQDLVCTECRNTIRMGQQVLKIIQKADPNKLTFTSFLKQIQSNIK